MAARGVWEGQLIPVRRLQPSFGEGFVSAEVGDLWEPWMRQADTLLEDKELLSLMHCELSKRVRKGQKRGRPGTSAEVVLRMLVLKHLRNFSFEELTREVRANLVYREFTRVGGGRVPDDKTMSALARQLGPDLIKKLNERMVEIARVEKIVRGERMRVDTTVVETDIHHPTDSDLLGDGVRVLTRVMKKVGDLAGLAGSKLRDMSRSIKLRVLEVSRAARSKGEGAAQKMKKSYERLLSGVEQVLRQAKRFAQEIGSGVKRALEEMKQGLLENLLGTLETMTQRTEQVMRQTKARVLDGDTHFEGKLLSIFEPGTEAIRKGKAAKPTEFGKMLRIQEAENQIVTDYEVYAKRPHDSELLVSSIEAHERLLHRVPGLVAADAAFYSNSNEEAAKAKGVKCFSVPNRSTKSEECRRRQKSRSFRKGQKWRTGCEGRISVLKRRHGLFRSRYKGDQGMGRWVGFGILADNLINLGKAKALQS